MKDPACIAGFPQYRQGPFRKSGESHMKKNAQGSRETGSPVHTCGDNRRVGKEH